MRDRLIALGMRRPMRVRDGDYDVPMLTHSHPRYQRQIQHRRYLI